MTERRADVYLYGMTLITTSHRLAGEFPAKEGYGEIAESHRLPGGETGTCAVVLGSFGRSVLLDGNHQGYNTYPDLEAYFAATPVSMELVTHDPGFEGLEDIVFTNSGGRTGFGRFCAFYADASRRRWNSPSATAIRHARVAGIDPFFRAESVEAARQCHEHGVKFATVDCPLDSEIHALADVNVLAAEFLRDNYPEQDLKALFGRYTDRTGGLVIFTFGAKELWFGRKGEGVSRFEPYQVAVASTLGAGDSFKAGVVYALQEGMDDATLVRFASATAAAACMHYPIAKNPPTIETVSRIAGERFERKQQI